MDVLMDRRVTISALLALSAGFVGREVEAAEPLVVVVNAKLPLTSLSMGELAAIFKTERVNFPDGTRIVPFNLPPHTEHRVYFDRKVLGMDPDEVARYWIDRRVRGGARPPRHVPSTSLLAKVVARLDGAIGYMPKSDVIAGIKVVAHIDG